jgi:enamine deaminase RidA (YjgF/YER057c/UK114 family)
MFIERWIAELMALDVAVLMAMVYGDVAVQDATEVRLRQGLGAMDWPLLWVEGASVGCAAIAGVQLFVTAKNAPLRRLTLDGRVVGTVFHAQGSRHCVIAGVNPTDTSETPSEQTKQVLERANEVLREAGFTYGDIARTWFYNDDILAWYDDFNRARTAYYRQQTFASGSLPASTAVRGKNRMGAALAFAAWAVIPGSVETLVREVGSPLQCPAPAYGSSFSRAMMIGVGGQKRLFVSGTASIEPGGKTIWQGDAGRQIELSMQVVAAILRAQGMTFRDVERATAYFKSIDDVGLFRNWCAQAGLENMPVVPVHCDICRDDLLFEIELDACVMG